MELSGPRTKTVLASIRAMIGSLPPGDRKVASTVLDDPEAVIHMTVAELAAKAGTAESTAVRCCHKLGYRGFQDLKIHLARELSAHSPEIHADLDSAEHPHDVLRTVLSFDSQVLDDVVATLEPEAFNAAVTALESASRVVLVGYGSSYYVCLEAEERLSSIGIDARAPRSPNMKLMQSFQLTERDVLVCVSHTGATKDVIRYADVARSARGTTVVITSYGRSRLARSADVLLLAGGRELDFRFDALSGRIAHLAVLDALYMALAQRLGTRAERALSVFHDEESAWRL